MTSIFPVFALYWSFFWLKFQQSNWVFGKLFKVIFIIYILVESIISIQQHNASNRGDKEMYTLLHGRSNLLLDYSDHPDIEKYQIPDKVESVFTNCKYDSPVSSWLHTPGEKITALYPSYQQPSFVLIAYFFKFKYLEYLDKNLRIKYEPYIHSFQIQKEMIQFQHELNIEDSPIPQIVILSMDSQDFLNDRLSPTDVDAEFRDRFVKHGCYEQVFKTIMNVRGLHDYKWRYVYRIKPQCFHRMIRAGYMRNPKNKSLGQSLDFDRAYLGYDSPYLKEVQNVLNNN